MGAVGTCLVLDGTNLMHRGHHALKGVDPRDDRGRAVGALVGLVTMTATALLAVPASSLVVAFDPAGGCPTRRALAPSYKAQRSAPDPALVDQLARVPAALAELGLAVRIVEGWEADDVLASVSTRVVESGSRAVLITSDKDAHQLVGERCVVRTPDGRDVDGASIVERYGVAPARWVEYAALVGEQADNLEGVRGIGPARAARLLGAVDDVEEALGDPARAEATLGAAGAAALAAGAETFRRNRTVGALRRDLEVDLAGLRLHALDPAGIARGLRALGAGSAGARLARALESRLTTR